MNFHLNRKYEKTKLNIFTIVSGLMLWGFFYELLIELNNFWNYGHIKYPVSFAVDVCMVIVFTVILILLIVYRKRNHVKIINGFVIISYFLCRKQKIEIKKIQKIYTNKAFGNIKDIKKYGFFKRKYLIDIVSENQQYVIFIKDRELFLETIKTYDVSIL